MDYLMDKEGNSNNILI